MCKLLKLITTGEGVSCRRTNIVGAIRFGADRERDGSRRLGCDRAQVGQ
jgi:hypothetical protein